MKRIIYLLALALILAPMAILASDVSDADYSGTIAISNNSTTLAESVSANVGISTPGWIAAGILNSTATNAAVQSAAGSDLPFMPGYLTNPWIVFVPSVAASGTETVHLYTGNVTGGDISYFPGATGMAVSDNNTLECGGNFTIELTDTFINTTAGSGKYLVYKQDSMTWQVATTTNGTIEASFPSANVSYTTGDDGEYHTNGDTARYFAQTFTSVGGTLKQVRVKIFQNTATTIYAELRAVDGSHKPTGANLSTGNGSLSGVTTLTPGEWYTVTMMPYTMTSGTEYALIIHATGGNVHLYWRHDSTASAYPGYFWISSDSGGTWTETAGFDWMFEIDAERKLSAAGVDSGHYDTVTLTADSVNMTMLLDGVAKGTVSMGGDAVPDNNYAWRFGDDEATPYIGEVSIVTAGSTKAIWERAYAEIFTDSVSGIEATPTYRTSCSDADVTASLSSFLPLEEAAADYNPDLDWPSIITTTPQQPDTAYTENTSPGVFFAGLIHSIWPKSGVPESFFWYNFNFATIIIAGILSFRIHPSLLLKIIVATAVMIFWALPGPNVYGMFVVIYKGLFCFGILVLSKHYGW